VDESTWAREAASVLGTNHVQVDVTAADWDGFSAMNSGTGAVCRSRPYSARLFWSHEQLPIRGHDRFFYQGDGPTKSLPVTSPPR